MDPSSLRSEDLQAVDCSQFWFSPLLPDAILTSDAVTCTCVYVFAADCCQANERYIEQFKDTLNTSVATSIAGFFAEPIQVGTQT